MELSIADQEHLAALERRLQLVRDRTAGVALGHAHGLHLWGRGGCGKSYAVLKELERLDANHKLANSRLSGRGLFDLLWEFPDAVHVLEDVEQMTNDRNALGVLRSALWDQVEGKGGLRRERLVTWYAYRTKLRFYFSGGIILMGNRSLDDVPELAALRTRIASLQLQPTNNELAALMHSVSLRGYKSEKGSLSPQECWAICEYVIRACLSRTRNLDMRLLVQGFADHLQWQLGDSETHWQQMVESRVQEQVLAFERSESRAEQVRQEEELAVELSQLQVSQAERLRMWAERTKGKSATNGKSARAYYRRLEDYRERLARASGGPEAKAG